MGEIKIVNTKCWQVMAVMLITYNFRCACECVIIVWCNANKQLAVHWCVTLITLQKDLGPWNYFCNSHLKTYQCITAFQCFTDVWWVRVIDPIQIFFIIGMFCFTKQALNLNLNWF